jgi:hypothetical protein
LEEFEKMVNKEFGRENFESISKFVFFENSSSTSKSIEENSKASQNNGITDETPRQRLFDVNDENIFKNATQITNETNDLFGTLKDQMITSQTKDAPQIMAIIDNDSLFVERNLNGELDKMEVDSIDSLDDETKDIVNLAWNLQNSSSTSKSIEETSKASQNNGITDETPEYFEEQEERQCAKHSINNMLQGYYATLDFLLNCAKELKMEDKHDHFDQNGDFDNQVIERALKKYLLQYRKLTNCNIVHVSVEIIDKISNSKIPIMMIVTRNHHHYSARRFYINGPLWLFNSLFVGPIIDDKLFEKLKDEIKNSPHEMDAPQIMALIETKYIVNLGWNLQNTVTPISEDSSNSNIENLTKQDLKSFAKEKDTVTENQVVDHSIILPDDSHSNKKVSTKSRKNTTKNQDCKSERLFREARRHNPPKKIFPFGSKLRGPTNCKTDALFDKARKLNKKLVVFNTKDYSKLTIENGQEFHECKKEGLKISEENTKLVNDALEKGQRVRRDGRNFIADDKKYIANRIINNKRVKGSRMSKSKK